MLLIVFLASALLCAGGLFVLARIAPAGFLAAKLNPRSNHSAPARQIGGLALVPAVVTVLLVFHGAFGISGRLAASLAGGSALLWIVGALDDRRELSEFVRLGAQLGAAGLAVYGLGPEFRLWPGLAPHWLEAAGMVVALVAAINIVNFIDGLDWVTVAGLGVPLLGVALLAVFGFAGLASGGLAAMAAGAIFGFAPFNRPPARIFLGDSGSLPLGLIAGVALLTLARETHPAAALIPPLYYVVDAVSTLLLRLRDGENILRAHSRHAYQVARRAGWSVLGVVGCVAATNVFLILCTGAAIALRGPVMQGAALVAGAVAAAVLCLAFRRARR